MSKFQLNIGIYLAIGNNLLRSFPVATITKYIGKMTNKGKEVLKTFKKISW